MLVGVFSDVHDNIDNLERVLDEFNERDIDTSLFLGDFCSPIPATIMGESFNGIIHCVFGNGDGDPFTIQRFVNEEHDNLLLHGVNAEIEVGGSQVALTHYPLYGQALARTGDYSAVFSGHTHSVNRERFGNCLWLNPGEVMGVEGQPTCAVYDSDSNDAEVIEV